MSEETAVVMPQGIVDNIITKIIQEVLPGLLISALDKLAEWAKSFDWAGFIDQIIAWIKAHIIKPVLG